MVDLRKRNTLKAAGAAFTASALASGSIATTALFAAPPAISATTHHHGFGVSELLIRIKDNAVQLTNLTSTPVHARHFTPGTIYWHNQSVDLNTLRPHGNLTVAPYATSQWFDLQTQTRQSMLSNAVWADDAVVPVDNRQSVLLGAYRHLNRLHVFPIPSVTALHLA